MTFEELCEYVTKLKLNDHKTYVAVNTDTIQVENTVFYRNGNIEELPKHGIIGKNFSYNQMLLRIDNIFDRIRKGTWYDN